MKKRNIVIISTSYPFGKHETFLDNEIKYLSNFFDIQIIPLINESANDIARGVPENVTYTTPILNKNHIKRFFVGIFNLSPLFVFIPELIRVFKYSKNIKFSLYRWYNDVLIFRALLSSKEFSKKLNSHNVDSIYFYWGTAPVALLKTTKKVFIRVHGGEIYEDRNFGYISFKHIKYIAKTNFKYLPISNICKKEILNISDEILLNVNRLGVYDNGLNPNHLDFDEIRIVSCSTLIPLKRVHLIIEALAEIKTFKIEWIHFGDGPLLDQLQEQVKSLSQNISVHFKGRVPNSRVLTYYSEVPIDLFVNVSDTEGVPVSIMEALSFGIPCFATNVGGTGELIDDSVGKIVRKEFSPIELTEFINKLKNREVSDNLRLNARKKWEVLSNADNNYKKLVEILKS